MSLQISDQARWWGIGLVVLIFVMWALGGVLLPFIVGAAIAYFLDPVADRLERIGCSRPMATAIITFCSIFIFFVLAILLIPTLVEQTASLIESAPVFFAQIQGFLTDRLPSLMEADSAIRKTLDGLGATLSSRGGALVNTVISSAFSLIDALIFMVVVPVVAFYLLLDWDRMIAVIDGWLPRDHAPTLRILASEVDAVLAGFVRGQLTVSAIQGTFYAVALMLVGLQFGLVVGLIAGLVSFIPYLGAVIGGVLAIGLAMFQFWNEPIWIGVVAGIFVIGQVVEGNFLTPKLVGKSVGLHPVWLMFSLSAFGVMFGFVGLLMAVPVAASIGVFSRFGLQQYMAGRLYLGENQPGDD